jgi:uncharacterized delta-60 repeat protein
MKKVPKLFAMTAMLLVLIAAAVRGQSALDGFDPNANGGVLVSVLQPDGKILIGGYFTTLSAVTRNCIARLNPDGTLDTAFNPNVSGGAFPEVLSIAVQADGKILVGGFFTTVGGQTRNNIARLDPTTGLADSWDPNANSGVQSIAVQADGKILAGGNFLGIGGQTRFFLARLDATTGLADSFNPHPDNAVFSIVVQPDNKILVGGIFQEFLIGQGAARNRIARLDPTTGLADSFDPNASNSVRSIAVQADGKVLAGGLFTSIGGQTRNRIARLDATTGLADSFDPNANNEVDAIAVQADGKILVGGFFNGSNSIGGQSRNFIARLDPATGLADSFDPKANGPVYSIAMQADSKILAGGEFTMFAPSGGAAVPRHNIARLETDGRVDQTLNLSIASATGSGSVNAIAYQPDGKILIGGYFATVSGVAINNIARLNTDGTLDTAFNPNADSDGAVFSVAVQADGKILLGGDFIGINGQQRQRIARLNPDGTLDTAFNPNSNGGIRSIAVQADGKVLAGGLFSTIGGQTRINIARLDATTGLADSFNPNANNTVNSIAVQADGKILVSGNFATIGGQTRHGIARFDATTGLPDSFDPNSNSGVDPIAVQADGKILAGGYFFTSIGGQTRNHIARLDATTGLADSFNPNSNDYVRSIAVQADGKILAGGDFTNIGGQTRNHIARLDATTGLADSFDANANDWVFSIAVHADGKVLVAGSFATIGGQTRSRFARLTNDTAALQNMAVTQTTITWTSGGSSPQFTRVTFEYSTDNVNYIPLGNGTAGGNNWTLTGLNLPTGQNFYIRARGCYRSGSENGSESITESVRNAFLAVPTPTPTPTPPPSVTISGTISYCSNPVPGPVPNVTLNLTGNATASTMTNGSGNYMFSSLPSGGSYTVTPTKAALPPGSTGINTVDVVATQRHFLMIGTPLTGCRLTAADVNGDNAVNTVDVVAIQRFFLILSTGTANVGKYQFNPASRSYLGIVSNQTAQNYDTLVFGDVVSPFVESLAGEADAPDE